MINQPANFTRALLGQGLALGWGDEAEAWLRSKASGTPYEEELAKINQDYAQFAAQHPIVAPATEFAGGMIPAALSYAATAGSGGAAAPAAAATTARSLGALGRLAANPVLRGMVLGGTTGAVAGAGAANPESRGAGALTGAAAGTALGGAIPLALHGGSAASRWLAERLFPTEELVASRAAGKINRALEEARGGKGMTPEDLQRAVEADRVRGIPSTVANADPALVDVAETVAQRSGASARRVEERLGEQARGSRQRVYERARKSLGGRDYFEDELRLVNELRNKAKDVYSEAYALGDITDPRILEVLKSPKFKGFYDEARKIADAEALAAKLRGEDPSKFRLNEIYSVDPSGNVVVQKAPDVRTLDYIKRGIDATIDRGFKGEGLSKAEASALRDIRREFVNAIDEATVDPSTGLSPYKAARQVYAGDMEVIDALRAGRNEFKKLSHQEIERLMKEMGTAEKEAFRTGVLQHVYDQVMNSAQNINAARRLVGSPETSAKLAPLFDSPQKFRLFKSALEREAQLVQQTQRVLGGAATGRRVQARERFEEGEKAGEVMAEVINRGFGGSLVGWAERALRSARMTDEMADEVSKLLMSSSPEEVAMAVSVLEKYGAKAARAAKSASSVEAQLVGGAAAAAPPAPTVQSTPDVEADIDLEMNQPLEGPDIEADLELENNPLQ